MSIEKKMLALQNKIDKMVKMKQITIAKNYKKTLDGLRVTLSRMYEDYELDGQITWEETNKYNRLQKLDKEVYTMITELYKDNSKIIRGTLTGIVTTTHTNTFNIINDAVVKELKPIQKAINTSMINDSMAGLKWTERLQHGRSNAIYEVQKEIKRGLTQGDTYSTMTKRLKKTLETDTYKAKRIVRTEGHRCFNQAKVDSLDNIAKQGVKMTKKWLTAQDERVRGGKPGDKMNHRDMNNVTIPYGDDFVLPDGSRGKSPGLIGNSNDINCRCIMTIDVITD